MAILSHIGDYFKYSTNTVMSFNTPRDTEFPKVIICNCNAVKRSALNTTLAELYEQTVVTAGPRSLASSKSASPTIQQEPNDLDADINGVDLEYIGRAIAHNMDTMLLNCYWGGGQNCSADNFTQVWTDVGVCYAFNGLDTAVEGSGLRSTAPGGYGGLWMQLNVEKSEYTEDNDFGSCFKVSCHKHVPSLLKAITLSVQKRKKTVLQITYRVYRR